MLVTETPNGALIPMPASPGSARSSAATASSPPCRCCGSRPTSPSGVLRTSPPLQATEIDAERRRPARQDPARDARRRDGRCSARCRSAAITARSTRRRSSSCWPARISSAPATSTRSARSGRTSRRRSPGSTTHGDRDGDGFVEYARMTETGPRQPGLEGQPRLDLPRRRQRSPKGRSRCARCRPMSSPRKQAAAATGAGARATDEAGASDARPRRCGSASRSASGSRSSAPTRWRWTATSGPAACAPPMPATPCSPASRSPERAAAAGATC